MNSRLPAWMRLTCKGRINRYRYFWYSIGTGLIVAIPSYFFLSIYGSRALALGDVPFFVILINYAVEILGLLYTLSFMTRRLHDLNRSISFMAPIPLLYILIWLNPFSDMMGPSSLHSLMFITPLLAISLLLLIYLYFFKGTEGPNPYGPDPLKYSSYEEYLKVVNDANTSSEDNRFER